MELLLFGASGHTGAYVLEELLKANHRVTAFVRTPNKIDKQHSNLKVVPGNVFDYEAVRNIVRGHDAVVSVVSEGIEVVEHTQSRGNANIIRAMEETGVQRLFCMGGIGILQFNENQLIRDQPFYPEMFRSVSDEHSLVWEQLQRSSLNWLQVCPPMISPQPANYQYLVKANYPASPNQQVHAGNIGAFIARELTDENFQCVRVGISNM